MASQEHIGQINQHDKSTTRLEILLQYACDIIFIFDNEFRYKQFFIKDSTKLYVNPDSFLNKYVGDVNIPESLKFDTLKSLEECSASHSTSEFEYCLPTGNDLEWYSSRTTPILDKHNNIVEYMCVITNITNARLIKQELERKQKQTDLFNKILFKLSTTPIESFESYEKAVNQIALIAIQNLGCSQISIWEAQPPKINCMTIATKDGINSPTALSIISEDEYPFYFSTLERGNSIVAEDVETNPYLNEFLESYLRQQNIRSTMDVPMRLDGALIGLICCENKDTIKKWTNEEEAFIRMLADILSIIKETFRRKEAEHLLNKTKKLLEDAYKISKMGVWEFDYSNNHLFFSDILKEFLKIPESFEPNPENISCLFKSNDEFEQTKKSISDLVRANSPFEIRVDLLSFENEEINTRITGNPEYKDNQLARIYGCIQDISEITSAKKDLKLSEDNFNIINQTINDVYWLYNYVENSYEFVSPNSEFVLGKSPIEFYHNSNLMSSIIIDEDKNIHKQTEDEILKHGFSEAEFRIRIDDKTKWFRERRQALYNQADGKLYRVSGVITDVTNIKKIESQLAAAKYLEEINKTKAQFLANITHEIRTPLNGIVGIAELLKFTNLSKEQREYLDVIFSSSKQLMNIVNEILDFSKSESGKLSLNANRCNLYDLLGEVIQMIKLPIEEKKIEFSFNLDKDAPEFALLDELKLKQVLINLLSNAYKFTSSGKITFTTQVIAKSSDWITLRFSIEDTGIGIKPENLQTIFEAFVQEDSSSTKNFGGTGLGLTISANLLKLMNSKIQVESTPNKGSIFYFDLTVQITDSPSQEKETVIIKNTTPQYLSISPATFNVLIVDDNPVNFFLLNSIIHSLLPNTEIVHAANGQIAVEKFKTSEPKIIFMDLQMPVLNGFEASKEIRKLDKDHNSIIIGTSAGNNITIKDDCLGAGMNDFLPKPIVKKDIESIFRTWLSEYTLNSQEPSLDQTSNKSQEENIHIDYGKLKHSMETNHAFMKSFMPYVRESLEDGLKELYEHFIEKDLNALTIVAHRIKGTALTACLPLLINLAKELEFSSEFDEQKIGSLIQKIDDEINEILKLI